MEPSTPCLGSSFSPWTSPFRVLPEGRSYDPIFGGSLLEFRCHGLDLVHPDAQEPLCIPPPIVSAGNGQGGGALTPTEKMMLCSFMSPFQTDEEAQRATQPMTPRALTPRTPSQSIRAFTPPPAPREHPQPALLKALRLDSFDHTREALLEDPAAAKNVFFDHGLEPPLCCAARLDCDTRIFKLLLKYQADVSAVNKQGFTPLAVLSSMSSAKRSADLDAGRWQGRSYAIAEMLMSAGADPTSTDPGGQCPSELARAAGNKHLVHLFEGQSKSKLEQSGPFPTKADDFSLMCNIAGKRFADELVATSFLQVGGMSLPPKIPFDDASLGALLSMMSLPRPLANL